MKFPVVCLIAIGVTSVLGAYNFQKPRVSRRDAVRQLSSAFSAAAMFAAANPANALDACPKGSKNCITTTWTPPSGTDANSAANTLKKVVETYPQEGQNKVDMGGWTIVDDSFRPGNTAIIEYKSGIGNFAKIFNGGKPFVDDLKLEIGSNGVVQARSSSRVGDSDLGVNQKRLSYFVSKLREEGWDASDPTY